MMRSFLALVLGMLVASASAAEPRPPEADKPEQIEFFEKKIRPIFADVCAKCHSAKAEKIKGGLLLDSREGVLKGGDDGPVIVPGDPDKSLLIKAVRYKDEKLQMPPKQKLSDTQIADLEAWVKMGAPDPRRADAPPNPFDVVREKGKKHWAFQPIKEPAVPKKFAAKNPIDAFVLAKLHAEKMNASPPADKRTLIRRVTLDLIGLPPTPEEVAAFLADKSPDAFARVVDRLLASPHYGERWGRYWLDVARYADTKGYVGGNEEVRFPYSYTYRDYVVRAFNEDLPYDQFIVQQIAADLLKLDGDNRPLAALGFLTLGRRFVNNEEDIVDDRIDVTCRGLMGMTVGCARCHDHKYDPIPTKDYYSLYGVFKSCVEPPEKPLLDKQPTPAAFAEYQAALKKAQDELNQYTATNETTVLNLLRSQVGDYLMVYHLDKNLNDDKRDGLVRRERKLNLAVHARWKGKLEEWKKTHHPIFAPWFAFEAIPDAEFATKAKELAAKFAANAEADKPLNPLVAKLFAGDPPTELKQVADRYSNLFKEMDKHWNDALAAAAQAKTPAPAALPDANEEALRQILYIADAPANPPRDKFGEMFLFTDEIKNKIETLKRDVAAVDATHAGAPPRAMVLKDKPKPMNPHVFIRGNPGTPGPEVPRQFFEILSGEKREPFPADASGRLQLAQAIASPDNPLTARVLVNFIWKHHFGAGLVTTPADFGTRGAPPSHPELLDYLASQFIHNGWSVKKLHRLILLSAAYQQSSELNERYAKRDPENRFLWRMNPQRLDFEAVRDSLLAVSARLDQTIGGRPVDITAVPFSGRRTVYAFIDRQELPSLFRVFDYANPDLSSPNRPQTTVPQQALFLLNSPFVMDCARNFVERPDVKNQFDGTQRLHRLYQVLYQRDPSAQETEIAQSFFKSQPANDTVNPEATAWSYGAGKYDEAAHRVTTFKPLPFFAGTAWQGSAKLPDPELGWAMLNADGGHPAAQFASIRRWTAPRDGTISIHADLKHGSPDGDGVRGRIISSRNGELGEWTVHNTSAPTVIEKAAVKQGDTIDFVVECIANENADSFQWSPIIEMISKPAPNSPPWPKLWSAQQNFMDVSKLPKPLGAWEKYAQVLLLSSEFIYRP